MTAGPAAPQGQPSGSAPAASTPSTPGRGARWLAAVPRHLGRARTSTVVLAVLFLAIGTLYLYVRPAVETTSPAGVVVQPVPVAPSSSSRTAGTASSTAPTTAVTSTSSAPTESTAPSTPATTSAPAGTPSSTAPAPSGTSGLPTVASTTAAPTS